MSYKLFKPELKSFLEDVVSDLMLPKKDGTLSPPHVIATNTIVRGPGYKEAEDYPFVDFAKYKSSIKPTHQGKAYLGDLEIVVGIGTFFDGSAESGDDNLQDLAELVACALVEKIRIGGYRLIGEIDLQFGSQQTGFEGVQAPPYYRANLYLRFIK